MEVKGAAHTYYWSMPVDDNAFLHLVTERGKTAFLHVSCSEWKNLFSIEIYGKLGKLEINGLGGSYGLERLTWYRMLPQMGPPETTIWEFPMADESWSIEMAEFSNDIKLDRMPSPGIEDAFRVLKVMQTVYEDLVMIFVRSPLRVSLGGGGTDLASYYSKHEGFLIAAAINKYVYVSAMRPFSSVIFLNIPS